MVPAGTPSLCFKTLKLVAVIAIKAAAPEPHPNVSEAIFSEGAHQIIRISEWKALAGNSWCWKVEQGFGGRIPAHQAVA
jgi:hypothetical protein